MKYILIFLLGLITFQVNAQKIIQAGSFATQPQLADTAASIRAKLPIDTTIRVINKGTGGGYEIADSFQITRFRYITITLEATGTSASNCSFPAADSAYQGVTFYIQSTNSSTANTQCVFFNTDLNGTDLTLNLFNTETAVIRVAKQNGAWIWIAVKGYLQDRNGIISALVEGDVDITGAASSDLRIRNTRIQFDAQMKIGSDSSFMHDPAVDTTVIKGDIVLGKFCSNNTFPFSMRNAASSSSVLLIESGATTGFAGLKLLSYNLPSQIEFGSATSKYLNFYNANNSRYVFSAGTNTNARTFLVGSIDPSVNGALIVNDTITSGKGLVYFRKIGSNSTPILTLTSVSNDRFVFHDDGRAFFNNLGTGTATQTLGITAAGQVVPYTQVLPTAHVSAIDANVDASTQINASINTYVTYYLTAGTSRTLTLPIPSSTLAGRSVILSYNATDFGYTGVILNTAAGYDEFWNANASYIGAASSFSGLNIGRQSTATWVCRQVNGTWYWVQDSYFDPSYTLAYDEYKTSVTGTTLTLTGSIETALFYDVKFMLFKNGLLLYPGIDYTISSTEPIVVTLTVAAISGDKFYLNYK